MEKLVSCILEDKNGKVLCSYRVPRSGGSVVICEKYIGTILHIHGMLGGNIIVGVDSLQQLNNEKLREDNKIAKYCVKSEMNKDYGNAVSEKNFKEMINRSSIIYAYGLSFGESDRSRWEILADWLEANSEHKLIIFKLNTGFEKFDKAYPRKRLDAIDSAKKEYLNLLWINGEDYEKYYSQLFIVDSSKVLNFKLIHEEPENNDASDIPKNPVTV